MSDKLEIPQVIRDAVHNALASYLVAANTGHAAEIACEAFARAMKEHPIVPTFRQCQEMYKEATQREDGTETLQVIEMWQRRMFDAPEPEVPELPESVFKTLYARGTVDGPGCTCVTVEDAVKAALEAYRRGKESREP